MRDQNDKDFLSKTFTVEKPNIANKVTKKKSRPQNFLTNQADPQSNANLVGFLATIAGCLGVHDFYCGNNRNGALKLIFSFFGFLSPISMIWSIVDCYRIGNGTYKSKRGLPLAAAPWCKKVAIVEATISFAIAVLIFRQVVKFFMAM